MCITHILISHFSDSSTKLSQNVCLIKMHIFIYWYVRCCCELWKPFWFYCVFWLFSYIIDEYSCLEYCILTKLTEIVCLINVYIFLVYQHAKCDWWLWKVLWFNCVFWEFFILLLIFTKLTQFLCLINVHIWFINTPNVTAGCGRFSDLIASFGNFQYYYLLLHVLNDITSSNLYKLYVKAEV